MSTDIKVPKSQTGATDAILIRREKVADLWLNAHRITEISVILDLPVAVVSTDIKAFREQLYSENKASLQEHAEQTVAILRKVERRLWQELETTFTPGDRLKILDQVRKTEEAIAKVRGLLNSRVIADVFHHVKMYDFEDNLPKELDSSNSNIINGVAKEVPELVVPKTPEPDPYLPEHRKPNIVESDESSLGVRLVDGTWLDLAPILKPISVEEAGDG
jgi:hypothetical protein